MRCLLLDDKRSADGETRYSWDLLGMQAIASIILAFWVALQCDEMCLGCAS